MESRRRTWGANDDVDEDCFGISSFGEVFGSIEERNATTQPARTYQVHDEELERAMNMSDTGSSQVCSSGSNRNTAAAAAIAATAAPTGRSEGHSTKISPVFHPQLLQVNSRSNEARTQTAASAPTCGGTTTTTTSSTTLSRLRQMREKFQQSANKENVGLHLATGPASTDNQLSRAVEENETRRKEREEALQELEEQYRQKTVELREWYMEQRNRLQHKYEPSEPATEAQEDSTTPTEKSAAGSTTTAVAVELCGICYEQLAEIRLKPCDHCLCASCCGRIDQLCPWDRREIESTEKLT